MNGPAARPDRPSASRAPERGALDPVAHDGDPAPGYQPADLSGGRGGARSGAPRRAEARPRVPVRIGARVLALVVLVAGLAITGAVTTSVRQSAEERSRRDFDLSADEAAQALHENLLAYTNRLRNVGSFLANAPLATPAEFRAYLESDHTFEDLRSVDGLMFVSRVDDAALPAFQARMARVNPTLRVQGFAAHRAGTPRYILTNYVAGDVDFKIPIGIDIGPIESVRAVIDRSADTHQVVVAALGHDPQLAAAAEALDYPLFDQLTAVELFIGVPVFGTTVDGHSEFTGWIGAPVQHFSDLLAGAARDQRDDLGLALHLPVEAPGQTETVTRAAEQRGRAGALDEAGFRREHTLDVNGLRFSLTTWQPASEGVPFTVPLLLLGGILASLLAATVVYLRFRTMSREQMFAAELADRAEFQRTIVDSVLAPLVVLDHDGRVVAVNRSGERLLTARGPTGDTDGDPPGVVGADYLASLSTEPAARAALGRALDRLLSGAVEAVNLDIPITGARARRWYAVRVTPLRGRRGGAVVLHRDVTERKEARDALEQRASRDPLTGLLNRSSLKAQLDGTLAVARRRGDSVGTLFLDLDGFKPVNDTLGHATGDAVLQAVAARVEAAVRPGDLVGRLGGDEFVVVMAPTDAANAERAATRVLAALADPIRVDGHAIAQRASIGVAVVDPRRSAMDGDELLERADRAMYLSKERGGAHFTVATVGRVDEPAPERSPAAQPASSSG